MRYLAVVKLSEWSKIERVLSSEKEAQLWAFALEGTLLKVVPVSKSYEKELLEEAVALHSPKIVRNGH